MKHSFKLSFIAVLFLGLVSCSSGTVDGSREMEGLGDEVRTLKKTDSGPVEISIDKLVGIWKYAEVRTSVDQEGIAPMGEILLGITDKYTLSFATEGVEELKRNLIGVPSSFEIRDNKLCAVDMSADIDFKLNFKSKEVSCYLLNENEMILEKGNENSPMMIYLYYTRID